MSFYVLQSDGTDAEKWKQKVDEQFAKEPMLLPEYASLFCGQGDNAVCACFDTEAGAVMYPFILRQISMSAEEGLTDIITPYGYGGPRVYGTLEKGELHEFWGCFSVWCSEKHVVSEFIRFMLWDNELAGYPGNIQERSINIYRELSSGMDSIWLDFEHKVRKNVMKAQRENLKTVIEANGEHLNSFLDIYYTTMERRDAKENYFFPKAFFDRLCTEMEGYYILAYIYNNDVCVSAELVLMSDDYLYSFLGGTKEEAFALRPNDLLKYEIIRWGCENGKKAFILGGGYQPDDGIYRYKRSLSPHGQVQFLTGSRIIDESRYLELVQESGNAENTSDFFPLYRA